jgi:hypothetical protein
VQPAPLRGFGALAVSEQAARCHGTGTGHAAQSSPQWRGWAPSWGVGAAAPGREPQAHDGAAPPFVRALNARVREQARACGAPSSKTGPVRGRSGPSSEAEPARGKRTPSNGVEPARGGRTPSSEAKPARGDLRVGRLGGPLGASAAWAVSCTVKRGVFGFVAGFKWGFPSCLRGPLGLSPTHHTMECGMT